MTNIEVSWEVKGIITPTESVSAMIEVIESKGIQHSGSFWTWENKVCEFYLFRSFHHVDSIQPHPW